MALSEVMELRAVLDSGVYNSLLTVSVQARRKTATTVFLFQCEDVRVRTNTWLLSWLPGESNDWIDIFLLLSQADYVQKILSQALR